MAELQTTIDVDVTVTARHDYHPFGEEIGTLAVVPGSPQPRTAALGYTTDTVRKQFTGYERDKETNLDYAINRYYAPIHGRFTSVDPYNIIFEKEKGKGEEEKINILVVYILQPQIWNKYSYSVNNPLKFTDPDGRRPLNEADKRRLKRLEEERHKAIEANDENLATLIAKAIDEIKRAIDAVPTGQEDPINLRVVFRAIDYLGDVRFANRAAIGGQSMSIASQGVKVTTPADADKCNFFIAAVYVLSKGDSGGGIGFNTKENPGGYQYNYYWSAGGPLTGAYDLPSANEIYKYGMKNFAETTRYNLRMGDVVASGGHLGIAVYGSLVISASGRGVRFGIMNSASNKYFTYKP